MHSWKAHKSGWKYLFKNYNSDLLGHDLIIFNSYLEVQGWNKTGITVNDKHV